jgi:Tfp pilus assembly protein PilF
LCNLGIGYIHTQEYHQAKEYLSKAYQVDPADEITISWLKKLDQIMKLS